MKFKNKIKVVGVAGKVWRRAGRNPPVMFLLLRIKTKGPYSFTALQPYSLPLPFMLFLNEHQLIMPEET